jgi:hypothetical protein
MLSSAFGPHSAVTDALMEGDPLVLSCVVLRLVGGERLCGHGKWKTYPPSG